MAFTLPPLPYAYDALEPAIDKETMTFHHDKHHQTYVDNLNKAVDADSSLQGRSLEDMFAGMSKLRPQIGDRREEPTGVDRADQALRGNAVLAVVVLEHR